jgi:hypothetical protein
MCARDDMQVYLRHGCFERLEVVAVEVASSDERNTDDGVARADSVDELVTEAGGELLVGRELGVRRRCSDFR